MEDKIKIVTSPEKIPDWDAKRVSIYLGGGIERGDNTSFSKIINGITKFAKKYGNAVPNLLLYSPNNSNPIEPNMELQQLKWEYEASLNADIYTVWFSRNYISSSMDLMLQLGAKVNNACEATYQKGVDYGFRRLVVGIENLNSNSEKIRTYCETAAEFVVPGNNIINCSSTINEHIANIILAANHYALRNINTLSFFIDTVRSLKKSSCADITNILNRLDKEGENK